MPMDGWSLRYLAHELSRALVGGKVERIMQPERDEIHILVRGGGENHRLLLSASPHHARAQLTAEAKPNPDTPPMLCQLMRKHIQGGRVTAIEQIGGDRILRVAVASFTEMGDPAAFAVICELMGRHSNIIFMGPDGVVIDAARHVNHAVSRVRTIMPGGPYAAPPTQDKLAPLDAMPDLLGPALYATPDVALEKALAQRVTGLSQVSAAELVVRAGGEAGRGLHALERPEATIAALCGLLRDPPAPAPMLLLQESGVPADFIPFPYVTRVGVPAEPTPTLSAAMDAYYAKRDLAERMAQKTAALGNTLKNALARAQRKFAAQLEDAQNAAKADEYRRCGDLLIGNLRTAPPPGAAHVTVTDWFSEDHAETAIDLDPTMDLRANAQRYYKLYRKAQSAAVMAAEQAKKSAAEIDFLEDAQQSLSVCTCEADVDEIREMLTDAGYLRANHNRRKKKSTPAQALRFTSSEGFTVDIGKTAAQNERLLASAEGDDIWMHAKDMPGSHVLVRCAGVTPGEATLREAALLAALYSKGGTSANIPVDRTLRRHVKKPAGARPGYVIYFYQSTLYVTPDPGLPDRLRGS